MHGFTAHLGSGRPPGRALDRALFGVLAPLVGDAGVTDVFVNPGGEVWVDRGHGSELAPMRIPAAEARDVATRLIAGGDRHVDEATPCVDVRLGDGIRVHAVLPPVSPGGAVLSIRVPRAAALSLDDLDRDGFFGAVGVARVRELVASRTNLLLTGAGGSGNTTCIL